MVARKGRDFVETAEYTPGQWRHSRTKRLSRSLLFWSVGMFLKAFTRVHDEQVARLPAQGPMIVAVNHINHLDIPVLYVTSLPRPMTGLVKMESWDNWLLRTILDLIDAIPVRRGEVDMTALKQALAALKAQYLMGIAPEGTRTYDANLIRGHHGVAMLGLLSKAPIIPTAHYGGEMFMRNLKRLRRTDIYIAVGKPFYLDPGGGKVTKEMRQEMADEIMYQIAALMPESYRGYYADLAAATTTYLRFLPEGEAMGGVDKGAAS